MFTNELNKEEMEALGISPQHYAEIAAGRSVIMNLKTGEYYAGSHDNGYVYWTADFKHKWHRPHEYSDKVPPFNELKRLIDAGYLVTAVVIG